MFRVVLWSLFRMMFTISPSCSFIWSKRFSLLVDSKPQMQQQKSKTQYSIPGGTKLEFFSKLYEVLLVGLSFSFSWGSKTSLGAWEISSEDDTKFSELPVTWSALSSLLFNSFFPGDFPRTLKNKTKTKHTKPWVGYTVGLADLILT